MIQRGVGLTTSNMKWQTMGNLGLLRRAEQRAEESPAKKGQASREEQNAPPPPPQSATPPPPKPPSTYANDKPRQERINETAGKDQAKEKGKSKESQRGMIPRP